MGVGNRLNAPAKLFSRYTEEGGEMVRMSNDALAKVVPHQVVGGAGCRPVEAQRTAKDDNPTVSSMTYGVAEGAESSQPWTSTPHWA